MSAIRRGRLVAFTGYAGSGKSTAADALVRRGWVRAPLAEPLKRIARSMGWNGSKDEKGRRLLQLLGTECGRECIGRDCWTGLWRQTYEPMLSGGYDVVIDDLRFDDEARFVHEMGGHVARVDRRDAYPAWWRRLLYALGVKPALHASERPIDRDLVDSEIDNNGAVQDMQDWIMIRFLEPPIRTFYGDTMPQEANEFDIWVRPNEGMKLMRCKHGYDVTGARMPDINDFWAEAKDPAAETHARLLFDKCDTPQSY